MMKQDAKEYILDLIDELVEMIEFDDQIIKKGIFTTTIEKYVENLLSEVQEVAGEIRDALEEV
jgi:hypothetical protein